MTSHEFIDIHAKGRPCSRGSNGPIDMSDNEAYMLQSDSKESSRLESQHEFGKALAHGHRVHPCIPTLSL